MSEDRFLAAVAAHLTEGQGKGGQRNDVARLTAAYREGLSSSSVDTSAYLTARLPATYAAVSAVLAEVNRLRPLFQPRTMVDAGAGPGSGSWAAARRWETIGDFTLVDRDSRFLDLAGKLLATSGEASLAAARLVLGNFADMTSRGDLVICSYALAEVPLERVARVAERLWQSTNELLVLVEPGTPAGFDRILAARRQLLAMGTHMVGPCAGTRECPLQAPDWCHFAVRLARDRRHMHAKGAVVPFEDEKFSWLAVSRQPGAAAAARVLAPPRRGKAAIGLKLCTPTGLAERDVAR
ncbi:MAG: SAM-dependent methyltransferase, partial [Alphaproteobacteria bacterium]|nr:SAM-dependent methyltransferase [Alphaproteobacteria bacterium]